MIIDKPDYLFHYTSVQVLGLILKNRNIRFNRLDSVDDLSEAETVEGKQLGQHFFISCWTDSSLENIPLWQMYTGYNGVRIKLSSDMFRVYEIFGNNGETFRIEKYGLYMNIKLPYKGPINANDLLNSDYVIIPDFYGSDFLLKVQYTKDQNLLIPKVLYEVANDRFISLENYAKYKSIEWSFQNEWRFILNISPINKEARLSGSKKIDEIFPTITKRFNFSLMDYFLDLREDIFNDIEILTGPKCNAADIIIIETLADKYAPKAIISKSNFAGKIK